MDNTQLLALKAAILADPNLTQLVADGATGAIAEYLRTDSTFVVWKKMVSGAEIMKNGMDWTQVDNLSVGKARIWDWLTKDGPFDASKANVRAGITECWKGTAAMLAVQAAVFGHCKRFATKFEKIYATGTGTDATPGFLVIEGDIQDYWVVQALTQV
jgi:hypothetical protein